MALLLGSWFLKYSFVVLDSVIDGRREVPAMSAEMVNPIEQRPLGIFLLMLGFYGVTLLMADVMGSIGVRVLRYGALAFVPAMVAAMSINGRFVDGLNPVAVIAVIARMPFAYFGMLAMIAALWWLPTTLLALTGIAGQLPVVAWAALAMYLWLAMIASIGTIVYEHREDLDYEPAESPERTAARDATERERERDRLMDPIFAEFRGGAFANAGKDVRAIIEGSARPVEEFRWMYVRAKGWPDARLAEYIAQLGLPHLLAQRATGEALELIRERLKVNVAFRPATGAQLLRLAMLARDAGDKPTARALIGDFDRHYPNDPGSKIAIQLTDEMRR